MNMDRQDGAAGEIAAGFRKPRTGSCRKPRAGPHPFVISPQQNSGFISASSPSSSPSDGKALHAENGHSLAKVFRDWLGQGNADPAIDCTPGEAASNGSDINNLFLTGESSGEMHKERSDSKNYRNFESTGEGESKGEWKMFQRREKRRDDWLLHRDTDSLDKEIRRDGDGSVEKAANRDESKYASREEGKYAYREDDKNAGSPEYERIKKGEKIWRDKRLSEKGYRDPGHRDRDGHPSKDQKYRRSDYSSRDRSYRERNDYSTKDWSYRGRRDYSYFDHRDRGGSDYYRDRDHQKYRRISDERGKSWRYKDGQNGRDSFEKHRNQSLSRSAPLGHNLGGYENRSFDKSIDYRHHKLSPENRPPTKLKVKVGGITHTIHADGGRQLESRKYLDVQRAGTQEGTGMSHKRSLPNPEPNKRRQRLILQENSDDDDMGTIPRAEEHVQVPSGRDLSALYFVDMENKYEVNNLPRLEGMDKHQDSVASRALEPKETAGQPLQAVRKSSRIPKKRVLDGDEDDEIEPKRRRRKKIENDSNEEQYQVEEDEEDDEHLGGDDFESIFEDRPVRKRRRRKRVELDISIWDVKGEAPLTARQRALQSSKEGGDAELGASLIEFPEGLAHSFPKKKKENLTEAERQLKKEEAARRRRQHVEKTVKEIQAVAIQKILCQDSQRKKKEDKLQKLREEMEQEKKAAAMAPASNSIRWIMGPTGTVVSFSHDLQLPNIFSGPCSYPPEREKCAAPSCNNAYKYRDSKSHLPLCSLQCFRAVQKPPEIFPAH